MAQKSLKMTQITCDQQRKSIIIVCAKMLKIIRRLILEMSKQIESYEFLLL